LANVKGPIIALTLGPPAKPPARFLLTIDSARYIVLYVRLA